MAEALADGAIFATRYRIVRCIAAGGMGAIYEVIHLETDRRRALKVMHPHFVDSDDLRDRFKREARVAAQIDSDYIVDVFDAGVDEATKMPFLVMELLKGEELGKALKRVGRFTPQDALNFLWQTALALDKTHKVNIVHRDLKPDNLFLNLRDDGAPRVKVLDFGVAKFVAETGTQANATRSLGTPLYMAPEQFLGKNVSPACDLYALAMMAYTLLTGHPYWEAEAKEAGSVFAFATDVQHGPREPASMRAARLGVQLGGAFDAWFYKATNARAEERYPTATATIAALGEVFGLNPARLTGVAADLGAGGPVSHAAPSGPYASQPGPLGGGTPVSARSVAHSQPGYAASQPQSQSQPGFGAQTPPGFGAQSQPGFGSQSQPGFGAQSQPGSQTSGAMVAPTAPAKSRVGAIAMAVLGLGVGAGVAVALVTRGGPTAASAPVASASATASAAPAATAAATASAAPTASASAAPAAPVTAAASAEPSAAPSSAPSAPAEAPSVAARRGPFPKQKPQAAAPAAPAATAAPTPKPQSYTRD